MNIEGVWQKKFFTKLSSCQLTFPGVNVHKYLYFFFDGVAKYAGVFVSLAVFNASLVFASENSAPIVFNVITFD